MHEDHEDIEYYTSQCPTCGEPCESQVLHLQGCSGWLTLFFLFALLIITLPTIILPILIFYQIVQLRKKSPWVRCRNFHEWEVPLEYARNCAQ